jgi:hypothetical protein
MRVTFFKEKNMEKEDTFGQTDRYMKGNSKMTNVLELVLFIILMEKDLNAAMEELRHHHELLKLVVDGATRLRPERDEARREVCNMMHKTGFLNGDYADSRGWDCFKEDADA